MALFDIFNKPKEQDFSEGQRVYELKKQQQYEEKHPQQQSAQEGTIEYTREFLLRIATTVESRFSPEDKKALLDIGRTLIQYGVKYDFRYTSAKQQVREKTTTVDKQETVRQMGAAK